MSNLVKELLNGKDSDTCYRSIGNKFRETTLACGFIRKNPGNVDQKMFLDFYSALVVINGEGEYKDSDNCCQIQSGDFVQRLPDHLHQTSVSGGEDWIEFFICINSSTYRNLLDLGLMSDRPVLKGVIPKEIINYFPQFLQKMKNAKDDELMPIFFEAQNILCEITKCCKAESKDSNIINTWVQFIHKSHGRATVQEVSQNCAISYESLRKKFHNVMGISIGKYIILARLNYAKILLLESDLKLVDIANKLGYADYFCFSKQFKQYYYISPHEYRKNNRLKSINDNFKPEKG